MRPPIQQYLDEVQSSLLELWPGPVESANRFLTQKDPELCGLALTTADGVIYSTGDCDVEFSIQSISKVFCYAIALQDRGFAFMDSKIDVEPSGSSFADLSSESGSGRPKNALINMGAIAATAHIVPEPGESVFDKILRVHSACAGRPLRIDDDVYLGDAEISAHNRALSWFLSSWGIIDGDPGPAHDDYTKQCAISASTRDLSVMAATLANLGVNPVTGERVFDTAVVQRVLSVMLTCGMYDDSGDWVASIGMPAKSGVGGGIISVLPGQLGLASFSPTLDEHGSSVRGLVGHRRISQDLELHFVRTSKAGLSTIRVNTSIDRMPSTTRRPDAADDVLAAYGHRAHIIEVMGDLLFSGFEVVSRAAAEFGPDTLCFVLDLSRADDIAQVSLDSLTRLANALHEDGVAMALIDPDNRLGDFMLPVRLELPVFRTRNEGLVWAEDLILREFGSEDCFLAGEMDNPILIGQLAREHGAEIRALLREEQYPAGAIIKEIGDPFDGIRFILSGAVHTTSAEELGGETVSILTAGMSVGELSLNEHVHQPLLIQAAEDTEIRFLPREAMDELLDSSPRTAAELWRAIAVEGYVRLGQLIRGQL